ncbi:alpha/beta hydrolase family protein [candidate division KSB1 bacterium]
MYKKITFLSVLLILCGSPVLAQEPEPMGDEAWKVLQEFFKYDKSIPFDTRIVLKQEFENYTRYKVVFTSIRNKRVPGYLAIPKSGNTPFPLILACHGGYGSKDNFWEALDKHNFLKPIFSSGYALFILDAVYHGGRIADNDYDDLQKILSEKLKYAFSDLIINTAVDYRRALDYLATRSDIDMDRIGVFGHSMGGIMTFLLTGMENRIKVAVPCVGPPTYPVMSYPTYLVHYAARFKNQPVLMLMGKSDPTYTAEAAEHLYKNINSKTKDIIWFESGHSLPPEWSIEAVKWFKKYLK